MSTGHIHLAMIALAGPKQIIQEMGDQMEADHLFDRVVTFDMPDDYGEFPDTTGYHADEWENIVLDKEDGTVYPYMTKCMDAALDYTNKQVQHLDNLGYMNIESFVQWPKFGGTIFAVIGTVTGYSPAISIVRH